MMAADIHSYVILLTNSSYSYLTCNEVRSLEQTMLEMIPIETVQRDKRFVYKCMVEFICNYVDELSTNDIC